MDLILLQPGDSDIFGGENSWANGGSLIDNQWRDEVLDLGQCLELVSVHQGMKQQITTDVSNSARTSGRPIITEFTCVKYVDKTSVKFFEYCLRAQPLDKDPSKPTKIYIARNSGDKTANILTMSLRNALISEIQFQSHPDDMPTEQFKLSFTEILWTYTVQKADTTTAGNLSAGWSIARNRPIGQFTD
ncbi:Hcp family type VI secretion system effector [Chitinolyticbacter meiyuanensis]|uniref:Hcp family type VI secretion system effector n=1 Tax=Chitinolyticbacter meiyuanensis TaxID=682798 RepID=UPI0011E5FD96|nr:type VI secretion system tube protein Hcp [Chitinolyticbacter meiyuanensis]